MKKCFFIRANGRSGLYRSVQEFLRSGFSPDSRIETVIPLKISGNTYKERQECARALALEIQAAEQGGLSWGEYTVLSAFFAEAGRRLGLLREFRENAIC